ncbi:MAG TPA: ATP-binding protein [bacterium]|nr:ATP-binding protein [bacterium]HMZ05434.1 ATP-binding protein [bacterium]HND77098.1 ATP-binding protein [bacterium]HNH30698.1 ATP-binding protein [bacterium]HNL26387.1 ATP-binding protein [bacterium]
MSLKRLPHSQDTGDSNTLNHHEILVVDDEENVLSVLSRLLSDEYKVHTATNGKDGLEILEKNPNIALIISDQRMPVMSGTEFLNRSISVNPDCIRIILTGYTDVKDLIESINAGRVFQYVTKPFETDDLRIIVKRSLDFFAQSRALERAHLEIKTAYENLKNAQEQLVRSEKMSMLGKLMSSIAHEIRNPINNISNSTKLISLEWADVKNLFIEVNALTTGQKTAEQFKSAVKDRYNIEEVLQNFETAVGVIKHSCDLVTEIVEDLRGFSRLDDAEFVQTDIHQQIERSLTLLKAKFKHHIEFVKDFGVVSHILGLPGPLSQVLINLINNAAQASPADGKVTIQTRQENTTVRVVITDNGAGIPKDIIDKIFDPGFTTKPESEGTGFGLSISAEIIKKHNGRIEVVSAPGMGSTFTVYLPVDPRNVS